MAQLSLGIDVGGTFTDFVLYDPEAKNFSIGKHLTTPENPSVGVIEGAQETLQRLGVVTSQLKDIIHGTTLVANLLIERKGVKVGFIATEGFQDTLELGREQRYDAYDLFIKRAEPLVPRYLRCTVSERIDWEGKVLRPLKLEELNPIAQLFQKEQVEAIAVTLMHSYRNSAHEQRIRDHLKAHHPQFYVTISSDVAPEVREHQRSSTTAANAYVMPAMNRYLTDLDVRLKEQGFTGTLYMMLSGGGVTTVDVVREAPIRMVESGPAAGAIAGAYYGKLVDHRDVISFDMGGTTAKICLITNGQPSRASELEVAREHRFKKGSGLILKVPSIEMIEIGTGGGSIASIDRMGLMKVGPQSAGADPGPACYGLGGTEPTVTDADLVLGYLDPSYFLGGEMRLNLEAAQGVIDEKLAKPMGMSLTRAAVGVHDVANEHMATAARIYASEQGVDPRRYAMVAFGGAGPVHAYRVAKLLHLNKAICPLGAGVTSSLGMLVSPRSFDFVQSYIKRLDALDWDYLNSIYGAMESHAQDILSAAGVAPKDIDLVRSVDMRYVGQGFEITVPIPNGRLGSQYTESLMNTFNETYKSLFRRHLTGVPVEAITWRLTASEPAPHPEIRFRTSGAASYANGLKGKRSVYLPEEGQYIDCPVYDRYSLKVGDSFKGPAIVEERESTVVVGPDAEVTIDQHLNLIMELEQ